MSEPTNDGRKSSKHPHATPKFRKIGPAEVIRVGSFLEEHLKRTPEGIIAKDPDGSVSYEDDWDDARVAAEAIPNFTGNGPHVVGTLRVKLYGPLRRGGAPKPFPIDAGMIARIEVIEAWLRHLGADLNTFPPAEVRRLL